MAGKELSVDDVVNPLELVIDAGDRSHVVGDVVTETCHECCVGSLRFMFSKLTQCEKLTTPTVHRRFHVHHCSFISG